MRLERGAGVFAGLGCRHPGAPSGLQDLRDREALRAEVGQLMSILRLTVVLEEVAPRVSRTVMVPSDSRLDRLHLVLQAALG